MKILLSESSYFLQKKNWEAFTFCIWSIWTTSMGRGVTVWFNTIAHYTANLRVITFFSVLVIVIQSLCEEWLRYILFLGDTRDQNQLDAVKIHKGRDWKLDATSPAVCGRWESVQAARQSNSRVSDLAQLTSHSTEKFGIKEMSSWQLTWHSASTISSCRSESSSSQKARHIPLS